MNKTKQVLAKFKREPERPQHEKATPAEPVTNESVSRHRDEILSKGRQFKYPFQHSKHRIAVLSIGLVMLALIILGTTTGLQLYHWQSTGDFTTGVARIIPFPVARVNGTFTSYESYLFELGSSLHWQAKYGTTDLNSPDGKRQIEYLKRSALDKAETNTIARSLAKKHNISVSEKEVDDVVARIKASGGDLSQILGESFDFTETELRRYIKNNILRQKVARDLDTAAPKRAAQVLAELKAGKAFADEAKQASEDLETKQLGGDIGVVEKGRANLPQEVSEKLFTMQAGQTSDVIKTSSDYFIVHVDEKIDENRFKVSVIRIKVKDMNQYLKEYRTQNKVKEYIKLQDTTTEDQTQ